MAAGAQTDAVAATPATGVVDPRLIDPVDALMGTAALGTSAFARERWPLRRVLRWSLAIGLVVLLGVEITLVTPYLEKAADALTEPNPWWLLLALGAEGLSMGAFARVQRRMLSAAGQRVGIRSMINLTYAANALSVTFPGGTAISSGYVFKRLRSWGATVPAAGFTVVASGLLSLVGFAVLATFVGISAGDDLTSSVLVVLAALAVVVTTLVLRRRDPAAMVQRAVPISLRRVNRALRRRPDAGLAAVTRFTEGLFAIHPRHRDWLVGLGLAVLNWGADLVCLFACCEAVGADRATVGIVMVAYVAGMSASSISLLPGGVGIVDAAMVLALTSGGVSTVAATAGVVLYRLISFLLVVAVGWVAWISTWMIERRHGVAAAAAGVAVEPVASTLTVEDAALCGNQAAC
ncbi:YbhN family protein [uncultured Jatrophihabitans sp.]|uniref:lysylphosphatidylglycerol synthase transmembrane domain-containing protein n=1 Tax=uncultured Jatrophihabitans sp. TaxID=1610747 RepID=UPI0035C9E109